MMLPCLCIPPDLGEEVAHPASQYAHARGVGFSGTGRSVCRGKRSFVQNREQGFVQILGFADRGEIALGLAPLARISEMFGLRPKPQWGAAPHPVGGYYPPNPRKGVCADFVA